MLPFPAKKEKEKVRGDIKIKQGAVKIEEIRINPRHQYYEKNSGNEKTVTGFVYIIVFITFMCWDL